MLLEIMCEKGERRKDCNLSFWVFFALDFWLSLSYNSSAEEKPPFKNSTYAMYIQLSKQLVKLEINLYNNYLQNHAYLCLLFHSKTLGIT